MLHAIDVGHTTIQSYRGSAGPEALEELAMLAAPLRGLRVLQLSATGFGGGVAEILASEIPMLRSLGLKADWKIINGSDVFFTVTKKMHNALQGAQDSLTKQEQETYLHYCRQNAKLFQEEYDIVVIHDPQPLALLELRGKARAKWIWRCHIDTSRPNVEVWNFLRSYLVHYDAAVFTLDDFVPEDCPCHRIEIIPPAIDPESPKNVSLAPVKTNAAVRQMGLDLDRPIVTQVSRFDPWKDPLGVIAAYKLAKREVPALQLALVGSLAHDDPEGREIYNMVENTAKDDPDIYVLTNLDGIGNLEVNALQRVSDLGIQKSIREGFGLVVSETLWKETPMVASRTGGIPLQMEGAEGLLVSSIQECADRTVRLLRNPAEGRSLAKRGKNLVRERFLLTRMVADELRLYTSLLKDSRIVN